jgi:twitching motility protein PilU
VLLNTKLVSELIEKGDFGGVKEAMEKSMAEGSQTFEETSRC